MHKGELNRGPQTGAIAAIVWAAFILGTVIDARIPIHGGGRGREINLSAFDFVVPLAFAYAALTQRIAFARIPWRIVGALALAVVVIVGHSVIAYRYGTWTPIERLAGPVDTVRLARETLKLVTVPIELAMLMALFTANEFRAPPLWVVVGSAAIVAIRLLFERLNFLLDSVHYFANIEANTLAGIMVLAIWMLWEDRTIHRIIAVTITIGITIVMVIALRKTYMIVCGLTMLLLTTSFIQKSIEQRSYKSLKKVGLMLGGTTILLIAIQLLMSELFYIGRTPLAFIAYVATHSSEIRFEIQEVAWHLALAALPLGIGVGQFGAYVPRIPEIEEYSIAFPHNTPLSFFLDMGVVGLALAAGLFILIYIACRGGSWVSRLSRLAFFVVPMIVNDTHGLRMTILLLAFFVVVSVSDAHAKSAAAKR